MRTVAIPVALAAAACLSPLLLASWAAAAAAPAAADSAAAAAAASADGSTLVPIPFVFYTPETETGYGAVVQYYFRRRGGDPGHPSTIGPMVVFTQREQFSLALFADLYPSRARWHLEGAVSYSRFPSTFWGVGNEAPDAAEEDYTPRLVAGELKLQRRLGAGWWAGPTVAVARRELVETEDGGLLDLGLVPGAKEAFVLGLGLAATLDSRDAATYPRAGALLRFETRLHDGRLGSDHDFTSWEADLRRYLPAGGSRVVAVQALAVSVAGEPPFDLLPALGGQFLLRGYYEGRYRDRNLLAAQAELRSGLWRRLGFAVFAGAGQVAHRPGDLALDGFRASGGAGLRILLSRREGLNLRLDWAAGAGETGFYFAGGEAF